MDLTAVNIHQLSIVILVQFIKEADANLNYNVSNMAWEYQRNGKML
jgi:hypothetical protein